MPNTKREFINGDIFHLFNRGVDKRIVFMDESDYYRFVFCLYECNDANFVRMSQRISARRERNSENYTRFHLASSQGETLYNFPNDQLPKRDLLVEIIAFTLMPNHYHLVVRQLVAGGISLFMKKLSNSYTGYFNGKYERSGVGALFQGAFKAVRVVGDGQFAHLVEYVFSNPVEIADPDWKNRGAQNPNEAIAFLNGYKWSSYLDSIGIENFPSVTNRDFLWKVFGDGNDIQKGMAGVKNSTEEWIKNKKFLVPALSLE
jgi:putative transposase